MSLIAIEACAFHIRNCFKPLRPYMRAPEWLRLGAYFVFANALGVLLMPIIVAGALLIGARDVRDGALKPKANRKRQK